MPQNVVARPRAQQNLLVQGVRRAVEGPPRDDPRQLGMRAASPWERYVSPALAALRGAGEVVAGSTPEQQAMTLGTGPGALAVSLIGRGLPPAVRVAARQAAVTQNLDQIIDPAVRGAAERFAGQYPRVFAHMNPRAAITAGEGENAAMNALTPRGSMGRYAADVSVNPLADPAGFYRSLVHEGSHTGQYLRDAAFPEKYAERASAMGYDFNPYERSASLSAAFHDTLNDLGTAGRSMTGRERAALHEQLRQQAIARGLRARETEALIGPRIGPFNLDR
jgi:hypothetical protein